MNSLAIPAPSVIRRLPLLHIALLLVAAAFLAGSMVTGSEILHKSHLRELASDAAHYQSLFKRFEVTYQALPGDMNNASSYWKGCRYDVADCNGNGDGVITTIGSDRTTEAALAWQHLSLANLLPKQYSGNLISGYYVPGENIPAAPYANAGYLISNNIAYHHASWGNAHYLKVGKMSEWQFEEPAVSLPDAMSLDHKMDDGIASHGDIMAHSNAAEGCLESYEREILVDKRVAHYATNLSPEALCNVYFRLN